MTAPAAPDPRSPVPEAPAVAQPLRTWRPMALWTAALLLALGLAWFIGAVVVPVWKTRAVVQAVYDELSPWYNQGGIGADSQRTSERQAAVEKLGGPDLAARRLGLYLMFPEWTDSKRRSIPFFDHAPRGEAFEILSFCGRSGLPPLMRSLGDSRSGWRYEAARALGHIGPEASAATPALARALCDADPWVRRSAARTLGEIGGSSSAEPLMAALEDQDDEVRSTAISALGKIDAPGSRPLLIKMLADESIMARCEAAHTLGRLGERKAVPALAAALTDREANTRLDARAKERHLVEEAYYVRRNAAEALGIIGDPQAIGALTEALKDENAFVRSAAAEALAKIRGEEAGK